MNVTFVKFGDHLASSRLRASIPQAELEKLGIGRGLDVLIYGKHWLPEDQTKAFGKRIFDCCDDHFHNEHGDYYRRHIENADLVTCNSNHMRLIILEQTGRNAIVIPEPYEGVERIPSIGPDLFWFGHISNRPDLERLNLDRPVKVMSNGPNCWLNWSPQNWDLAMNEDVIVIIPTGKSMAKSENRMVEAIRGGKYVCAEFLPAYMPFYQFFPLMDINEHVEKALSNPEASINAIHEAQDYIRDRYSPKTIALKWKEVIESL